jgi:hypothetical protein
MEHSVRQETGGGSCRFFASFLDFSMARCYHKTKGGEMLKINCVWEHNGEDSLLYCDTFPGAFTRGASREEALRKMSGEVSSFLCWMGEVPPRSIEIAVIQEKACELNIRDADSDVLFDSETAPLTREEYDRLKALTLRSAADFHAL